MKTPAWLSMAMVTAIHDEAIYEFGGLAGVRDIGLLESALDRPRNLAAYEPRSTWFELAASLCVGVTKNHAFIDGNKRTALLATGAFLFLNGQAFEPGQEDEVVTMIGVAAGTVTETQLAAWLRRHCTACG